MTLFSCHAWQWNTSVQISQRPNTQGNFNNLVWLFQLISAEKAKYSTKQHFDVSVHHYKKCVQRNRNQRNVEWSWKTWSFQWNVVKDMDLLCMMWIMCCFGHLLFVTCFHSCTTSYDSWIYFTLLALPSACDLVAFNKHKVTTVAASDNKETGHSVTQWLLLTLLWLTKCISWSAIFMTKEKECERFNANDTAAEHLHSPVRTPTLTSQNTTKRAPCHSPENTTVSYSCTDELHSLFNKYQPKNPASVSSKATSCGQKKSRQFWGPKAVSIYSRNMVWTWSWIR